MPSGLDQPGEQALANLTALPHFASFAEHRQRLTASRVAGPPPQPERTLCVLGAGNCFDLDLEQLAKCYDAVHLVDLDAQALERTFARQDRTTQDRLVLHA